MSQTDSELAGGVVRGDEEAFARLFDRYEPRLRDHVRRIIRDEAAAADVTQEVFLRLWRRAEQWTGKGAFQSWLLRIGTNLALNHLRSVRRRREQPIELPTPSDDDEEDDSLVPTWMIDGSSLGPDEALERAEQRQLLSRFVGALPEDKQEVFRMIHDAAMETREVAEQLGIPEGTVKSRMHHARKQIAREWQQLTAAWEDSR